MWVALIVCAAVSSPDSLQRALREAFSVSCPGRHLEVDPDLSRAARSFVLSVQDGRSPLLASGLSFHAGLESTAPAPVAGVATISPPSRADRAVGDLLPKTCAFDRAGVAAAELPGNRAVVALVTAAQSVRLRPIPGQVKPGSEVIVDGLLASGLREPRLYVSQPGGRIEERPVTSSGSRVVGRVRLPHKGEAVVELLATGEGGPQVIAIRRIFVGVAPPRAPPPERRDRNPGIEGVEAAVLRLRSEHGLRPLHRDAELDAVAERHSREMARSGIFAHVLPSDGSVGDRLDRAGYARTAAGENIGLGETALAAQEGIESSPAHMANLLDPRFSRLGVGIARGPSPDGGEGVYLTEVLASPVRGSGDPEADVLRSLQAARARAGLEPLERDRTLEDAAKKGIQRAALAGAPLSREEEERTVQSVLEGTHQPESAVAEAYVISSPEEVSSKNVTERSWSRVGVGALYKSSAAYGPGRLWVLILFAR